MRACFAPVAVVVLLSFHVACAHKAPPPIATEATPPVVEAPVAAPTPAAEPAPAPVAPEPEPEPSPEPAKATLGEKSIDISTPIVFADKKSDLLTDADAVLKEVAAIFHDHPELKLVRIEAYSANDGVASHNLKLCRQRAQAVKKWLTGHGVDINRLTDKGFGAQSPVADNSTPEGREKNWRIEFKVLKKK